MLSLRSRAAIRFSAIRCARALSSAAFHCVPDRNIGSKPAKMVTKIATNMAASMCSLLTNRIRPQGKLRLGAQRTRYETSKHLTIPKFGGITRHLFQDDDFVSLHVELAQPVAGVPGFPVFREFYAISWRIGSSCPDTSTSSLSGWACSRRRRNLRARSVLSVGS